MERIKEHSKIRILYYLIFTAILVLAAYAFATLFITLVLGFLLAFLTEPIVDWLERRHWSRHTGAMVLFLALFAIVGGLAALLVPKIVHQVMSVIENQTEYIAMLESRVTVIRIQLLQFLSPEFVANIESTARDAIASKSKGFEHALPQLIAGAAHWLSTLLFVPIIAFFFLVEGAEIKKWFISLLPNRYFEMSLMLIHQINSQLGGYLRGQAMDCIVNGTLYAVGLSLLGVKGAVVIGIFAGLMNAVPYVGPIVGAIPGMFSLMIDPGATMPWWSVAILFVSVHLVDNTVIYPMTVGKSLDLPPFAVILGIIFGGSVAGIPGMFLTVPLLGMAKQSFIVLHSSLKSYRIIG